MANRRPFLNPSPKPDPTPNQVTRGLDKIATMKEQLAAGENVILLANHQTEADPQIFSLLLDEAHPGFASSTIFVAGDRVS